MLNVKENDMPIARLEVDGRAVWTRIDPGAEITEARTGYARLEDALAGAGAGERIEGGKKLLVPLEPGARIVCIGLNYRTHAEETGHPIPEHPVVFYRTHESLVGDHEPMILPAVSNRLDWEGELAVVIGTGGHRIDEARALEHVAGYTCFNDGSLRDWQTHTSQFSPGKNFDRSGAIGPMIALPQDVGAPEALSITTRLNGEIVQDGELSDLIFPVPALIVYVSSFMTLRPGDVIATGTPSGVGGARKPPRFMAAGDVVEIDIPGVGLLTNEVRAENEAG